MKASGQDLGKLLAASHPPRAILLHSDDEGHLFLPLEKIKKRFGTTWLNLAEKDIIKNPALLEESIKARNLFQKNQPPLKVQGGSDKLAPLIQNLIQSSYWKTSAQILLVISPYLKTASKLRTFFEKSPDALAIGCWAPSPQEIKEHIGSLGAELNVTFDQEGLLFLQKSFLGHPGFLRTELTKARDFVYPKETLTLQDLKAVITSPETLPENAIELFLKRDKKALYAFLTQVLADDRNPISIIKFFQTVLLRFSHLLTLERLGVPLEQAAFQLRPPLAPFQLNQIKSDLKKWTPQAMNTALHTLLKAEVAAKKDGDLAEIWMVRALFSSLKK